MRRRAAAQLQALFERLAVTRTRTVRRNDGMSSQARPDFRESAVGQNGARGLNGAAPCRPAEEFSVRKLRHYLGSVSV
jgi:hypothetical protein